jgi:hypothetical protein
MYLPRFCVCAALWVVHILALRYCKVFKQICTNGGKNVKQKYQVVQWQTETWHQTTQLQPVWWLLSCRLFPSTMITRSHSRTLNVFKHPLNYMCTSFNFQNTVHCTVAYLLQNNYWLPYPLHFRQFKGDNGSYADCCNLYIYWFLSECQLFILLSVLNIVDFFHCTCCYPHTWRLSPPSTTLGCPMSHCHATS